MSNVDDIKKLCDLSKLEIPSEMMMETTSKIREVLTLFDKLDEFDTSDNKGDIGGDIKIEKSINSLRDDQIPNRNSVDSNSNIKIKPLNTKDGYVLGPRI
jgi:aspartyl/glutamyl-tRNA(Asn/Gln) amidotransferase C subunit